MLCLWLTTVGVCPYFRPSPTSSKAASCNFCQYVVKHATPSNERRHLAFCQNVPVEVTKQLDEEAVRKWKQRCVP